MLFGIINAGATFLRAMDIEFRGLVSQSVVVYLDDVTMISKKITNHLCHLRIFLFYFNFFFLFWIYHCRKQDMINTNVVCKWNQEEKEISTKIKQAITKAPTLFTPNFDKYFMLYTFASNSSLAIILTHKYDQGNELPFHSWVHTCRGRI